MATTTATFTHVSTVAVPVTDQVRTKTLFESLGFEVRLDAELRPGFRWIELGPPGGPTSIALVATGHELPTGVDTGIRFITDDAQAARDQLIGLGCSAGELLAWAGVPLMFSFTDPDGNRFYVTQAAGGHPDA